MFHRARPTRAPKGWRALLLAIVSPALLAFASATASAATFTNACANNVSANRSQADVTMTAYSSASAEPGDSFRLSSINQTIALAPPIWVDGYNLGLLTTGLNTIPATARTVIEGTNTIEGTQSTNDAAGSITTTITDPDGVPGTGDESATPPTMSVTYNHQTWTAGGSTGTIEFREDTITPLSAAAPGTGGIVIDLLIGDVFSVRFVCSPGTVTGPDPGTITFDDPAVSFNVNAPGNQAPTANAGPDQTVASEASVDLDGTGSDDPDGDTLAYSWTQTSGPSVTLSGADTATPSFTAPVGPATLVFQLEVCDQEPVCDTDTVTAGVRADPPTLTGESFHQDLPTITSADCNAAARFTYSYFATGTARGPYPGTFTETGTLIFNRLEASFTIDSPAGQVTGTKTANAGVGCASGPTCSGAEDCSDYSGASYNTRPGGFDGTDTYEATIRTAGGAFADNGLFSAVFYRVPHPSPLNGFNSDFLSALASPVPLGPTTKKQCKNGDWRGFDFKNQGQCVAFVERRANP